MAGAFAFSPRARRRTRAVLGWTLAALGALALVIAWMNRPGPWDATRAVVAQPAGVRATGRTGVVVFALIQPERYDPTFYDAFFDKLLKTAIPWPVSRLAGRDRGVALIDPMQPDMTAPFQPRALVDAGGRDQGADGVAWIEHMRRGDVEWIGPSERTEGDIGTFLYAGEKAGAPTAGERAKLKARYLYYARLPGGALPMEAQTRAMVEAAFARLRAGHDLAGTALFDAFHPERARAALASLLDQRLDTLVVASALPFHSGFEEYSGGWAQIRAQVDEQARASGRPAPRILFAPQLGEMPAFSALWAQTIERTVAPPPAPDARATLILSLHGLPGRLARRDPWTRNSARAVERLKPALDRAMRARGWTRITMVSAQEAFADGAEDPDDDRLSTREAFEAAAARGDALALAVPVEFLAENTDTLFLHSLLMFEGLPGYARYQGPPVGVDWSRPYVRQFRLNDTDIVFTGTPGGDSAQAAGAALAQAIAPLLPARGAP
jgi:hypothetical protein